MKVLDKLDEGLSIAIVRHQYDAKNQRFFSVKKNEGHIRGNIKF